MLMIPADLPFANVFQQSLTIYLGSLVKHLICDTISGERLVGSMWQGARSTFHFTHNNNAPRWSKTSAQ